MAASANMGQLIDGLLVLSRATRGDLERAPVDLSTLAQRIREELERSDPAHAVAWEIEPGLTVWGDGRMLDSLMRNLLGNAWKYSARTAAPCIRVYSAPADGKPAVHVVDNGAGFDMAFADQLFQPFRRLHRQDEFPGLGIGLATVQRIVHRHGGSIQAKAVPGQGAEFFFSLPEGEAKETT
jgi:signal transduction histidine kinase